MAVASKIEFLGPNRDGEPRRFTVASATAIAKGTLLTFGTTRLAAAQTLGSVGEYIAGVAGFEKSATDDSTTMSAITQAIMTFTSSGTITAGNSVVSAGAANTVEMIGATEASGAAVIGYAMSDATGNECEVRINL